MTREECERKIAEYCAAIRLTMQEEVAIATLPSVENKGEWIPATERLPKERQAVLCWAESTAERLDAEFIGKYDNGVWFLQSDANHLSYPHQYNVVAWQPLPEPYMKGGE